MAAVAALSTLTVLLYKHIQAEKELTQEQINRKKVSDDLNNINQKANENTLETVTRVKLLKGELKNVTKGSKEWENIVGEINDLTGLQLNSINDTETSIGKATDAWIKQYKIRAKSEAIIQQIVQNELDFQQLSLDVQTAKAADRKAKIDELPLLQEEKDALLEQLNIVKGTFLNTTDNIETNKKVMMYIGKARNNMIANNEQLEKQLHIESLINYEKGKNDGKTKNQIKDTKDLGIEIRKLKNELYNTGENLIIENTSIELAILEKSYQEEYKKLKEQHQSTEELEKLHLLQIELQLS